MSEFAFFRFKSNNMLTKEEEQHKDEIIKVTEEVLDAKGIECDARIAKISEDDLREILEEVRRLRKKRKRFEHDDKSTEESEVDRQEQEEEEAPYIR
jgi:dynactin complex subunit